ncbi:MAG: hypothetical protein GY769_08150 [bacterium]|nr:hypothetical protein [bacterium]
MRRDERLMKIARDLELQLKAATISLGQLKEETDPARGKTLPLASDSRSGAMTADHILAILVKKYPGLLPWGDSSAVYEESIGVGRELRTLIGSWCKVNRFLPHEHPPRETNVRSPLPKIEISSYRNPAAGPEPEE